MSVPGVNSYVVPERYDCQKGDLIGGRYFVESVLGQGSFGCVYKVKDFQNNLWALKLLRLWEVPASIRQPLIERFDMEYRTGRISSRNLVHSADSGFLKGNPYIVMEFCDGGDITKYIGKADAPLPQLAMDILNGLAALHSNGKVHRDLKPENVLLKHDGTAVLTDFGISGDRNKRMTERNIFGKPYQIFGTYAYMPPEQVNRARGNSTVLPTTDLFSFGVMMFQLVTGELPFGPLEDENDLVRYQKRGKAGEWNRSLLLSCPYGQLWEKLIARCLVPDLKERVQTAAEAKMMVPQYGNMVPRPVVKEPSPSPSHVSHPGTSLKVMQGVEYGKIYNLDDIVASTGRRIVTVGRDETNSIQLQDYSDSYCSRRHLTLENQSEGVWILRDGQWDKEERVWNTSTNGSYVNSARAETGGIRLNNGDIITAGDIKLRFETSYI